ncbi:MAG: cupin domain-containing protein, partial [Thermoplasmata archaeon]
SENVFIVLDGQLEVCVEGVRRQFARDDVVFIPAGLRHWAGTAPVSPVPARVIEIYAPPGPDFHVVDDGEACVDG